MAEDRYIQQVSDSIKDLFDLTARIDERVISIAQKQVDSDHRMEKFLDTHAKLVERVVMIESKDSESMRQDIDELKKEMSDLHGNLKQVELGMNTLNIHTNKQEVRWRMIFDVLMKVIIIVAASIIIWKFGIG